MYRSSQAIRKSIPKICRQSIVIPAGYAEPHTPTNSDFKAAQMEIANWNYVKTFSFLVSQNLLQLAAITHCTSSEGIGSDSSEEARHHLD